MPARSRSLLDFLEAPVVVGDPDGRAVYTNPAFETAFAVSRDEVRGRSLAELFEGGGREAVLRAVAGVCGGGSSLRFKLRAGEQGYVAMASPIEAEQGRVGVLILLTEEIPGDDRAHAFQREIQEPLEDLARCLDELSEQTGGRRADHYSELVEDAARALDRIRKRAATVHGMLSGSKQRT